MRPRCILRRLLVLAAILFLPANALAASAAFVSAGALNLRTGPGTNYEIVASLYEGTRVAVHGYTSGGRWCDVSTDGLRGWVWCGYLDSGVAGPIAVWGPALGLSVIVYSYDEYFDRHYHDRHRYRDFDRDEHDRKRKTVRERDRDRDFKPDKRDRKRKTVRGRDRDRDFKRDKRDRKRKTVRQRDRGRDFKPDKRDRKRKVHRRGGRGGSCGSNGRRCRN